MADITFIFHKEWVDNIAHLSVDKQDAAIADMVRYGCKMELQHTDDDNAQTAVNFVKGKIDYSKDKYEQKIEAGKKNGGSNKKLYDYCLIFAILQKIVCNCICFVIAFVCNCLHLHLFVQSYLISYNNCNCMQLFANFANL